MKQITDKNFKDFTPDEITDFVGSKTGEIVVESLHGIFEIVKYAMESIGQRKQLRRRVEALESAMQQQMLLNKKLIEKINELDGGAGRGA